MMILLSNDKEGVGRYREINLAQGLPNICGLRIKEIRFDSTDKYHIAMHRGAAQWIVTLFTAFECVSRPVIDMGSYKYVNESATNIDTSIG